MVTVWRSYIDYNKESRIGPSNISEKCRCCTFLVRNINLSRSFLCNSPASVRTDFKSVCLDWQFQMGQNLYMCTMETESCSTFAYFFPAPKGRHTKLKCGFPWWQMLAIILIKNFHHIISYLALYSKVIISTFLYFVLF